MALQPDPPDETAISALIAKALGMKPIDNLEDLEEGTVIQAICEDGQSRIGMYIKGRDGTARLVPLSTKIPLRKHSSR